MYMYRSFWKRHTLREWFSQVQKDFSITCIYCSTENTDDHPTNTSHLCIECNHALLSRSWCSSRETVTNNYRPWTWIKLQLYNIYIYTLKFVYLWCQRSLMIYWRPTNPSFRKISPKHFCQLILGEIIYSRSCNLITLSLLPPNKRNVLP